MQKMVHRLLDDLPSAPSFGFGPSGQASLKSWLFRVFIANGDAFVDVDVARIWLTNDYQPPQIKNISNIFTC